MGSLSLFLSALILLPASQATHDLGPGFVGVFFDDPAVSFSTPTAAASKTKSVSTAPAAGAPALAPASYQLPVLFGGTPAPVALRPATDVVAAVWLSASQEVPLAALTVDLVKASGSSVTIIAKLNAGATSPLRAADGSPQATLKTTPSRFYVTGNGSEVTKDIEAGALTALRIGVLAPGADGQPVDVKLHFGSAEHPSGIVFGNRKDPGSKGLGYGAAIYLDGGNKLTMTDPTAKKASNRTSGNAGMAVNEAAEWEWGSTVVPEKFTLLSDGIFNMSLQIPGGTPQAGARVVVQVHLYIDSTKISGATNYQVGTYAKTAATQPNPDKVVVALPLRGVEIPAGSTVKISLQIQAAQPGGTGGAYEVLYGSEKYASGLVVAASYVPLKGQGGGKVPTTTAPPTTGPPTTQAPATTGPSETGAPADVEPEKKKGLPSVAFSLAVLALLATVALVRRRT